jgi:hypothetical protein
MLTSALVGCNGSSSGLGPVDGQADSNPGLCPGGAFQMADTAACAATFDGTPPSSTGFPTISDTKGACGGYLIRILGTMVYEYVCIFDPTTKQLAGLRFVTDTPDVDTSCSGAGTTLPKACNSSIALADAGAGG